MSEQTLSKFKCLRCGHTYAAPFSQANPQERTCPKCRSNSVRRLKEDEPKAEGSVGG